MKLEDVKKIVESTFGDSSDYILERVSVDDFKAVIYNYNFEYNNSKENSKLLEALKELLKLCERLRLDDNFYNEIINAKNILSKN